MRVAYQGVPGAYSEAAVLQRWGDAAEPLPKPYLEDVFDAVEAGDMDAGLVPVENTIEGSITRTYDLLYERSLKILGEAVFRVRHCLIALPSVEPGDVKRVYSHPQALGQTRAYLASHGYTPVGYHDTAGAVKMIRDEGLRDSAAVASRRAAVLYGMSILAEGIEDNLENYTRFLHIGREETRPTGRDKTSISFTLKHEPGALAAAHSVLSNRGINVSKIETRPIAGKPWEYRFFVDFEGHTGDPLCAEALRELAAHTDSLRVLGSYPRA